MAKTFHKKNFQDLGQRVEGYCPFGCLLVTRLTPSPVLHGEWRGPRVRRHGILGFKARHPVPGQHGIAGAAFDFSFTVVVDYKNTPPGDVILIQNLELYIVSLSNS